MMRSTWNLWPTCHDLLLHAAGALPPQAGALDLHQLNRPLGPHDLWFAGIQSLIQNHSREPRIGKVS